MTTTPRARRRRRARSVALILAVAVASAGCGLLLFAGDEEQAPGVTREQTEAAAAAVVRVLEAEPDVLEVVASSGSATPIEDPVMGVQVRVDGATEERMVELGDLAARTVWESDMAQVERVSVTIRYSLDEVPVTLGELLGGDRGLDRSELEERYGARP